jgi:outer membrane receptor protein involved in Fe transport
LRIVEGSPGARNGPRECRKRCLLAAFGALLGIPWAYAYADAVDTEPLEEITVTATKRETKLLETPISMTVIGEEALKDTNADAFADFARLVPGLTAIDSGPGQKRYALRGLQSAGEPEVALYYDEIPTSGLPGGSLDTGADQPDVKLWDVDRIEVLRGPQGTLYGDGSMGGAIRIISKRPDLTSFAAQTEAEGAITQGGASSWGVSGMVNAPIVSDQFAVRLTIYDRQDGGWLDQIYRSNIALPQHPGDDLNGEHTSGARLSATWQATDKWSLTGIAYYQHLQTGMSYETYPSFAVPGNPYVTEAFVRKPWDDVLAMANLISTYDLGWASFVASGAYQNRVVDQSLDTTRFLLSQFGCTQFTWNSSCFGPPLVPAVSYAHEGVMASSGEVRLVSQRAGPLQWTLGAFLQRASTYRDGQVATADAAGYIDIDAATDVAANRLFARRNYDQFDQDAIFGEATYDLYRGLKFDVGLRWFHSYRTDQQIIDQQFFPGQPTGTEPFQTFGESALFKKFQLSYEFNPRALVYIEAAQGFRAGGPNYPGGFTETAPPYRSDSVWDYEIGWKTSFADERVFWSGALFHIDWSDLQQLVPTQLFSYIVNAGSARSDGFETEFDTHLIRHLDLSAGVSYSDARLIGPQPLSSDPTAQLSAGNRLGGVPAWTSNVSASYGTPVFDNLSFIGRADYTYQSSRPTVTAIKSPAYFVIGASHLTSLHALLERKSRWTVGLHVDNLFNGFEPISGQALDSNLIKTITAAPPRTIRITLTTYF